MIRRTRLKIDGENAPIVAGNHVFRNPGAENGPGQSILGKEVYQSDDFNSFHRGC